MVLIVCNDFYTSAVLAEEASKIASLYSDVFSAKILNAEQCKELKMGSYLGVAAASANPPHFIHLCYKPPGGPAKVKLALIGKGLTFDRCIYVFTTKEFLLVQLSLDQRGKNGNSLPIFLGCSMSDAYIKIEIELYDLLNC